MLDGRYRDKRYLSKYDLGVELFERFNLKVNDVVPIRNVYVLTTNKGEKVLKKIDYSIDDLDFIHNSISYVKSKFDRVIDFVETKDGRVFTEWRNEIYCVMDLVPGRECDFNNPIDLSLASKALAGLHKASEGLKTNREKKFIAGKNVDTYKRRYQELQLFSNIAKLHEYKTEFDTIFLENVDLHLKQMEESIKILEASSIAELCKEKNKIGLCHNDLAYHNILINEDNAYFIDFDYAIINLKVHDLCNFINKVIKNFAFDLEKADTILKDYCSENSLDNRELEVLYGMLYFPEDFYSISRDYYTRRKDWEEEVFLDRLIKKVSYREERTEFLEDFKKEIVSV